MRSCIGDRLASRSAAPRRRRRFCGAGPATSGFRSGCVGRSLVVHPRSYLRSPAPSTGLRPRTCARPVTRPLRSSRRRPHCSTSFFRRLDEGQGARRNRQRVATPGHFAGRPVSVAELPAAQLSKQQVERVRLGRRSLNVDRLIGLLPFIAIGFAVPAREAGVTPLRRCAPHGRNSRRDLDVQIVPRSAACRVV